MRKLIMTSVFVAGLSSGAFAQPASDEAKPAAAAEMTTTIKKSAAIVEIEGSVVKVVTKKKEIYVKDAAGKKHEFYFTDATTVTSGGAPADFSALKEGTNVKVSAEKHGRRLTPIAVEIR